MESTLPGRAQPGRDGSLTEGAPVGGRRQWRLGYLGPEGSFSHEAALHWASGRQPPREPHGMAGIERLFEAASSGELEEIVCPIENALEGTVSVTVDLWLHQSTLYQVGEVILPVEHRLLVRPGVTLGEVEAVLSHPHALAQCRRTLAGLLPGVEQRPVASTAEAARLVAESQRPWAAVAGPAAERRYGLTAVHAPVQDGIRNATRFGVFGRQMPGPSGFDRTTIVIGSLEDRPGLLRDLLAEFADRGINLTRIESRPARQGLGQYLFLIDLEGHPADRPVREALRGVRGKAGYLRLLGAYRRAEAMEPIPGRQAQESGQTAEQAARQAAAPEPRET